MVSCQFGFDIAARRSAVGVTSYRRSRQTMLNAGSVSCGTVQMRLEILAAYASRAHAVGREEEIMVDT
jgi:hypothetical protein